MTFEIMTALNSQDTFLNMQKKFLSSIAITASVIVAFVAVSIFLSFTFLLFASIVFKATVIVVSAGASVLSSVKMNLVLKTEQKFASSQSAPQQPSPPESVFQLERQSTVLSRVFNDVNMVDEVAVLEARQSSRRQSLRLQRQSLTLQRRDSESLNGNISLNSDIIDEEAYQEFLGRTQGVREDNENENDSLSKFIIEEAQRLKQKEEKERQEQIEEINKQNILKKDVVSTSNYQNHLEQIRSFGIHRLKKIQRQEKRIPTSSKNWVLNIKIDVHFDSDSEWED